MSFDPSLPGNGAATTLPRSSTNAPPELPGCTGTLICPQCQNPMRVIAVIDQREVVEKILRHLGLWSGTPLLASARAPADANVGPWTREPCDDVDPMPDYENILTD